MIGPSTGCQCIVFIFLFRLVLVVLASKESAKMASPTGGSSKSLTTTTTTSDHPLAATPNSGSSSSIQIVFSDLDGTLIHYPKEPVDAELEKLYRLVQLPPSSTGMVGYLSQDTFRLCREIRAQGIKLVFVSGMRYTTLVKRLPYLPRADAYCCEGGGRIFYSSRTTADTADDKDEKTSLLVTLAVGDDKIQETFWLKEDLEWRRRMQELVGPDGHNNHQPVSARRGLLWNHARHLQSLGYTVDASGYSTCFRVNQKHQDKSVVDFDNVSNVLVPPQLASTTNLGCVDFYPAVSGKKNWYVDTGFGRIIYSVVCLLLFLFGLLLTLSFGYSCLYLAASLLAFDNPIKQSVCICDDDNDLEMALACSHAFIPSISSSSMASTMKRHDDHFTDTRVAGDRIGTLATENALGMILERIGKQ